MPRLLHFVAAIMLGLSCTMAAAQSSGDLPLGDVARNARKAKVATKPAEVHIDNDNFSKVMEDAEARRRNSAPLQLSLGLGPGAPVFPSTSPAVTCSLSFSSHGLRLTDALVPPVKDKGKDGAGNDLPAGEISKLEGPATIVGDSLQLSIFNGTSWQVEEITVGLTILRHPSQTAVLMGGGGRLVAASSVQIVVKRSDTTLIYHFKGTAAPNARATFSQPLGITLGPDQEWHWAIIDAKGTPPKLN